MSLEIQIMRATTFDRMRTESEATNWPMSCMLFMLICCALLAPTLNFIGAKFSGGEELSGEGNALRTIIYLMLLLVCIYAKASDASRTSVWPVPFALTLVLLWALVSVSWALNPEVAVRRLLLTTMIVWMLYVSTASLGYEGTLRLLRIALLLILVSNFFAVFFAPTFGITTDSADARTNGAWRGVLMDKNHAGAVSAFTVLLFSIDGAHIRLSKRLLGVLGGGAFLVMSNSKTSLALVGISLLLAWLYRLYNPYYRVVLSLVVASAIAASASVAWVYSEVISAAIQAYIDDPDSLTGRVQIWPVVWDFAREHIYTGAGFGSFWNIGPMSPVFFNSDSWISQIASGHNGYLDLLVQLGIPGLILTLVAIVAYPFFILAKSSEVAKSRGQLLVALLVFCLFHNFTETSLFDRDAAVFVMLLIALSLLQREQERRRAESQLHDADRLSWPLSKVVRAE